MDREKSNFWDYARENPFWAFCIATAVIDAGVVVVKSLTSLVRRKWFGDNGDND